MCGLHRRTLPLLWEAPERWSLWLPPNSRRYGAITDILSPATGTGSITRRRSGRATHSRVCPLLAQSRPECVHRTCLLSGVQRIRPGFSSPAPIKSATFCKVSSQQPALGRPWEDPRRNPQEWCVGWPWPRRGGRLSGRVRPVNQSRLRQPHHLGHVRIVKSVPQVEHSSDPLQEHVLPVLLDIGGGIHDDF